MKIRYKILFSLLVLVALIFIVTITTYQASQSVNYYRQRTVLLEKQLLSMTTLRGQVRNQLLENYEVGFIEDLNLHEIDLVKERKEVATKFALFEEAFKSENKEAVIKQLKDEYKILDTSLNDVTNLLRAGKNDEAKAFLLNAREVKFNNGFIKKMSYFVDEQKKITEDSSKKLELSIYKLQQKLIFFLVLAIVIVVLLILFVFKSIGQRLFDLEQATRKITDGNFEVHLSEEGSDEISGLTKAFNQMATSLTEAKERLLKQQEVITHTSKMSALGEMAGGIAHEINTPLAAITLNAEMIAMSNAELAEPDEEIEKRTQSIISIVNRIAKIIMGLRGFSRNASNDESADFKLSELVNSTIDLCNEKFKNHGVEIKINENHLDTLVHGQIVQLSQTLMNLLNNSYDAIQGLSEKWILLEVEINEKVLNLKVIDSGHGIDPEIVDKIFNPFFTSKEIGKGTGLGLSISKNIVRQHGGDLLFDDKNPHTCFIIQLPIAG